jgi:hypothetical protein
VTRASSPRYLQLTAPRAGITPAGIEAWAKEAAVKATLGISGVPPLPKPPSLPKPGAGSVAPMPKPPTVPAIGSAPISSPTVKGAPAAAPLPPGVKK